MEGYKKQIDQILLTEKRYRDPKFSAKKLAELLGVSVFKLSRLLKAEYGMSYAGIVHQHRIKDAIRHLKDPRFTPFTVDDIGQIVGFGNRQSFFDTFKEATGTTPKKFRKSNI